MGDAIERAKQSIREGIAAREGRTQSGEQSTSDRASQQDRQEHMPATKNQIDRDERKRQFDAERNRPTPNEQAENRKATQDYVSAQRKSERYNDFDNTRNQQGARIHKPDHETAEEARRRVERERRSKESKDANDRKRKVHDQAEKDAREVRERQQYENSTTAKEFNAMRKRNEDREFRNQHVDPMLPFGEFVKKKAHGVKNEFVQRTKDSFTSEIAGAKNAVQGGRQRRARMEQEDPLGSFWGTPPPAPYRPPRGSKSAPMGTGFLFSEGFLNPPKGKTGRKRKGTATPRRSFGMGDMLL
jgi:hypothetical protein